MSRRQILLDGVELSRGLYLSSAVEPDLRERCYAWSRVLPPDSAFGFHTAAALFGVTDEESETIHAVMLPRRVLPQRAGFRVHARRMLEEDIVDHAGLRVTAGAQTFLDLAAVLPSADLFVLGDRLMRAGHVDHDALARRLGRADRVRGVVRARRWAPHVSNRAASPRESLLRFWLLDSGLPEPTVQLRICDRFGRQVASADLGYDRWKIALEYEGRQHADPEQFGRDIDRYSLMAADDWLVLRFAARHGRHAVVERTRRALINRGWQPESS